MIITCKITLVYGKHVIDSPATLGDRKLYRFIRKNYQKLV